MREGPFVISCFSSTGARHAVAGSGYGLTVALHLHRAQRTDTLADELGELLASPLPDPFAQEVVVVPEQGIERWLAQRLSHRLGTDASANPAAWLTSLTASYVVVKLLLPVRIAASLAHHDRVMHAERTFWEKATAAHVYCVQGRMR